MFFFHIVVVCLFAFRFYFTRISTLRTVRLMLFSSGGNFNIQTLVNKSSLIYLRTKELPESHK